MNGCEKYQELISRLIDNDLSEDEKSDLAEHLRTCPECAALYGAFYSVSQELKDNMQEMPPELHENIMAEIRREDIKKKNKKRFKPFKALAATAACAAIIVAAGFAISSGREQSPVMLSSAAPEESPASDEILENEAAFFSASDFSSDESAPAQAESPGIPAAKEAPVPEMFAAAAPEGTDNSLKAQSGAAQAPGSYELNKESWDKLLLILNGSQSSLNSIASSDSGLTIYLSDVEPSLCMNIFLDENEILYRCSDSDIIYTANCNYGQIEEFLESLY